MEGTLAGEFHAYRTTQQMGTELELELSTLGNITMDGTSCEAVHGQFANGVGSNSIARMAYRAATVRLEQNVSEHELACNANMSHRFNKYWTRFKMVLSSKKRSIREGVGVKLNYRPFLQKLYRFGDYAYDDWSLLDKSFQKRGRVSMQALGDSQTLKKDFVSYAFKDHVIYSVKTERFSWPTPPTQTVDEVSQAIVEHNPLQVFQVVSRTPQLMKTSQKKTNASELFCPFRCDVMTFEATPEGIPATMMVTLAGPSRIVDVLAVAEFKKMEGSPQKWRTQTFTSSDCIQLARPEHWRESVPLPLSALTCPAVLMLKDLDKAGWKPGIRDKHHVLSTENKVLHIAGCSSRPSYLLCLVLLEELKNVGRETLPHDAL